MALETCASVITLLVFFVEAVEAVDWARAQKHDWNDRQISARALLQRAHRTYLLYRIEVNVVLVTRRHDITDVRIFDRDASPYESHYPHDYWSESGLLQEFKDDFFDDGFVQFKTILEDMHRMVGELLRKFNIVSDIYAPLAGLQAQL